MTLLLALWALALPLAEASPRCAGHDLAGALPQNARLFARVDPTRRLFPRLSRRTSVRGLSPAPVPNVTEWGRPSAKAARTLAVIAASLAPRVALALSIICPSGPEFPTDVPANARIYIGPLDSAETKRLLNMRDGTVVGDDGSVFSGTFVAVEGGPPRRLGGYVELVMPHRPAAPWRGVVMAPTPGWSRLEPITRSGGPASADPIISFVQQPDLDAPTWRHPTLAAALVPPSRSVEGLLIPGGPHILLHVGEVQDSSSLTLEGSLRRPGGTEPPVKLLWSPIDPSTPAGQIPITDPCGTIFPDQSRFIGEEVEATLQLVDVAGNRSLPYTVTFVVP